MSNNNKYITTVYNNVSVCCYIKKSLIQETFINNTNHMQYDLYYFNKKKKKNITFLNGKLHSEK